MRLGNVVTHAFALGALAFAGLGASAATAATVLVNFDFLAGSTSVASGNFTYNSADTGVISYSDLFSYNISFPGQNSYNLAFVNSGSDSVYRYFGFDTGTHTFVSATIGGFPEIMSDIKSSFTTGFFTRDDSAFKVVRDYGPGGTQSSFDTLKITVSGAVPEPATWGLMLVGLGATGAALRSRRRVVTAAA